MVMKGQIMCGIVGYIGKPNKIENIIKGIKNLEYRGYDSAGIAYRNDKLIIVKEKGQISNLEKLLNLDDTCEIAISHTRWATHGIPNDINAHPHQVGKITVVHNGILENYQEIKKELIKKGVAFKSETDTEVIAALINDIYNDEQDMKKSLKRFLECAKGAYALGIMVENDDALYILKKESPLIVALCDDGFYIASDVPAILEYTNKYFLLNDNEYGILRKDSYQINDIDGNEVKKETKIFEGTSEEISKQGFEHFMLKEINEEAEICKNLLAYYIENIDKIPNISNYKQIDIVGCGSAFNVGLIGKYLIEKYAHVHVNVNVASEYRYQDILLDENSLVIFISQSGETADTLAAVKKAKAMGTKTLGIVNVVESSIARNVDEVIYTKAGIEIAVATTKAYLAQMIILILLALKSGIQNKTITDKDFERIKEEIKLLPIQINKLISQGELYDKVANFLAKKVDCYFLGRGIDYPLAQEGSLKLKEISYIHAEAYAAGELKHGTISLIEEDTPVVGIVTDSPLVEKMVSNLKEVTSRGGKVLVVTNQEELEWEGIKISVPKVHPLLQSILTIIPLQVIAYQTAKMRGCSIDKPKNLAKSVTVE